MNLELVESSYKPGRKLVNLKIRVMHPRYGPVICIFHFKQMFEKGAKLSQAFVEGMAIPHQEHQDLLTEIKNNAEILHKVKDLSEEIIKNDPAYVEEKVLEEVGALSNLSLDYLVVLAATSTYTKEIKRHGSKLSTVEESDNEKHKFSVLVKFKELKDEYKLSVTYDKDSGYKIKSTKYNKDKPRIMEYLDEKSIRGIIIVLRSNVDFLP